MSRFFHVNPSVLTSRSKRHKKKRNSEDDMDVDEEERKLKEKEVEEKGEKWRVAPTFLEAECNIVNIGEHFHPLMVY